MNIFTIECECGETIFGPRLGGKARGAWLGYDKCPKCRDKAIYEQATKTPKGAS